MLFYLLMLSKHRLSHYVYSLVNTEESTISKIVYHLFYSMDQVYSQNISNWKNAIFVQHSVLNTTHTKAHPSEHARKIVTQLNENPVCHQ